jgi:hypothetical protein
MRFAAIPGLSVITIGCATYNATDSPFVTRLSPPASSSMGSGNLCGNSNDGLIELIGIATPVVTPLGTGVKNNTLGTRQ